METEDNTFKQNGGSGEEKSQLEADWTKWRRKILALSRLDEVEKKNLRLKQTGRSGEEKSQLEADWTKWKRKILD